MNNLLIGLVVVVVVFFMFGGGKKNSFKLPKVINDNIVLCGAVIIGLLFLLNRNGKLVEGLTEERRGQILGALDVRGGDKQKQEICTALSVGSDELKWCQACISDVNSEECNNPPHEEEKDTHNAFIQKCCVGTDIKPIDDCLSPENYLWAKTDGKTWSSDTFNNVAGEFCRNDVVRNRTLGNLTGAHALTQYQNTCCVSGDASSDKLISKIFGDIRVEGSAGTDEPGGICREFLLGKENVYIADDPGAEPATYKERKINNAQVEMRDVIKTMGIIPSICNFNREH